MIITKRAVWWTLAMWLGGEVVGGVPAFAIGYPVAVVVDRLTWRIVAWIKRED